MKIKREIAILFTILPMTFMATLDSSIVNVALPTMARELSTSMAGIEWVVTSYLIAICATILMFGRFGDMIGKARIFKIGLLIFTLGSLLCGVSTTLTMLIISRVVQAIGASAAMATNQAIITETFPPNKRGKALGSIGTAVALGTMVGPVLGGLLVSIAPWQVIFLVNVPVGIVVYIMTIKVLVITKGTEKVKFDVKGSILYIAFILLLFGAIDYGQEIGYKSPIIIGIFISSILVFIGFVAFEKRVENPMIDISIFKNKLFSLSIFCAFIVFIITGAINIILPFYYQDVLGLTARGAGLIMTVAPITLAAISPVSGHISDKVGSERITFIGLIILTIGTFSLVIFKEHTSLIIVGLMIGLIALGSGVFQPPNNSLIMSTVDRSKLGVAGSINSLVRNLGIMMGTTLAASLLYTVMSNIYGQKVDGYIQGRPDVFISAMHTVFIVIGCITLIGTVLTFVRMRSKTK